VTAVFERDRWKPHLKPPTPASRYIDTGVDPVVLASAPRKHGITDEQTLHAYRNPNPRLRVRRLTMLVGADASGRPTAGGVVVAEGVEFIVHAMPARDKFIS
jgi:hypothetical protein